MTRTVSLLEQARVASPCSVPWEAMKGDDRVRFCDACKLSVYNLSAMGREEAEELIRNREGRMCVNFYRRADGTILTRDCPVGLRAARLRFARMMGGVAAGVAFLLTAVGVFGKRGNGSNRLREMEPFSRVYAWFNPAPPAPPIGRYTLGITISHTPAQMQRIRDYVENARADREKRNAKQHKMSRLAEFDPERHEKRDLR